MCSPVNSNLGRPSARGAPGGRRPARRNADARPTFSLGEQARGVLELAIVVAVLWRGIVLPDLLFLPLLAAAGLVVAALAWWDDRARAEGSESRPETNPPFRGTVAAPVSTHHLLSARRLADHPGRH